MVVMGWSACFVDVLGKTFKKFDVVKCFLSLGFFRNFFLFFFFFWVKPERFLGYSGYLKADILKNSTLEEEAGVSTIKQYAIASFPLIERTNDG